jgi:hypothetical protein
MVVPATGESPVKHENKVSFRRMVVPLLQAKKTPPLAGFGVSLKPLAG